MLGARNDHRDRNHAGSSASRAAPFAVALAGLLLLGGCGTGGSLNPFGGASDVDTAFLAAAGSWDRNKDGIVSCEEWKAYAAELFDAADANKDGALTSDEYDTILKTDRMFETVGFRWWDANGDGKVSRAEFVDRPNPAFVMLDKDKKCQLTSTELAGGRNAMQQKKPMVGPPPDLDTKKMGR